MTLAELKQLLENTKARSDEVTVQIRFGDRHFDLDEITTTTYLGMTPPVDFVNLCAGKESAWPEAEPD